MDGWIKLYRKMLDWDWWTDSYVVHVFIYLLLTTNHTATKVGKLRLKAGQKITSASRICDDLQISKPTVLRCLKVLSESGTINVQSDNKKSIITIVKFSEYQQVANISGKNNLPQDLPQGLPQDLPQGLPPIYNKNIKNIKNDKNNSVYAEKSAKQKTQTEPKKTYGEYQNVMLTDSEAQKLHEQFGDNAAGMVEYLSAYKIEKNYKTKSDYLTIKRWVADAYFKSLNQNSNGNNNGTSGRSIQERAARIAEYAFAANGL